MNKNRALTACLTVFFVLAHLIVGTASAAPIKGKDALHEAAIIDAALLLVEANTFDASVQENWPQDLLNLSHLLKPEGSELAWDFQQFRYLKLLKRPIATSGRLDVTLKGDDITVNWKVVKPVASEFRIENGKVKQKKKGKWQGLGSAEQPAFVFVSRVMNQALLGDFSSLSEHFDIYFLPNTKDGWSIGLKPKDIKSQLASMVEYITLAGLTHKNTSKVSAELSQIMIMDVRGEASLIMLRALKSL